MSSPNGRGKMEAREMWDDKEPPINSKEEEICLWVHATIFILITGCASYNYGRWKLYRRPHNWLMWKLYNFSIRVELAAIRRHHRLITQEEIRMKQP